MFTSFPVIWEQGEEPLKSTNEDVLVKLERRGNRGSMESKVMVEVAVKLMNFQLSFSRFIIGAIEICKTLKFNQSLTNIAT